MPKPSTSAASPEDKAARKAQLGELAPLNKQADAAEDRAFRAKRALELARKDWLTNSPRGKQQTDEYNDWVRREREARFVSFTPRVTVVNRAAEAAAAAARAAVWRDAADLALKADERDFFTFELMPRDMRTMAQISKHAAETAEASAAATTRLTEYYARKAEADQFLKQPDPPKPAPSEDDSPQWAAVAAATAEMDAAAEAFREIRGQLAAIRALHKGKDAKAQQTAYKQAKGAINADYFNGWEFHRANRPPTDD